MTNVTYPDPRAAGFNYGVGWGSAPKPLVFYDAVDIARKLRKDAADASRNSWELDMLIRDVRLAGTEGEKRSAVRQLADWLEKSDYRK